MAGKIFINYRRDDSIGTAGRLHDRLAPTFGRNRLDLAKGGSESRCSPGKARQGQEGRPQVCDAARVGT
jgi:hypothetical protein